MGIEPTSEAWEASILPLYDARSALADCTHTRGAGTTASCSPRAKAKPVPAVTLTLLCGDLFLFLLLQRRDGLFQRGDARLERQVFGGQGPGSGDVVLPGRRRRDKDTGTSYRSRIYRTH